VKNKMFLFTLCLHNNYIRYIQRSKNEFHFTAYVLGSHFHTVWHHTLKK